MKIGFLERDWESADGSKTIMQTVLPKEKVNQVQERTHIGVSGSNHIGNDKKTRLLCLLS